MAAKLLHSLTDDNPDLHKQIGCMNGIFQIFDRHHILTSRRIVGHSHKRLPPGNSHFNNGSLETESNMVYHQRTSTEMNSHKNVNEKQRVSTESSRASFSSSSGASSLSSLECNKTAQPEPSSFDRMILRETPSREPVMNQSSGSPGLGRQSLDLRDVVKDSMYREVRGLSVKTTSKEEAVSHVVKHKDSPRPLQLSKSVDGSYKVGINGKQNLPVDLKESLKVLAKLQEAPWYFNEPRELSRSRSSYEAKDGSLLTIYKDAPRFSYDGREINRSSFESRDSFKSTPKVKELPRLSLDSREGSMQGSNSDSRSNSLLKNLQNDSNNLNNKVSDLQQTPGTQRRPAGVVAKLMGLEGLPDSSSASDSQIGLNKTCGVEDCDPFLRSSKTPDLSRPIRVPNTPRNSWKDPTSPRRKNPDPLMKPVSSSRFPIEPAPWKQLDGRVSLKPASRHLKAPARATNSFPSVYSEIEKRLKDLEFKQSGKDLRALKQILETMQAKGFLETGKEEQATNFGTSADYEQKYTSPDHNPRLVKQRNAQSDRISAANIRGTNSSRTFESPIVIMKPAKLLQKSGIPASSVIPFDGLSGLNKIQGGDFADSRKGLLNSRIAKDQTSKNNRRDHTVSSTDKKTNGRNLRTAQNLTRPQQLPKENTTNLAKSSGSVSPRMQQKKLEFEKRSRPPTPSSDTSKPRRQSNKQPTESGSPGGKLRAKSSYLQQSDDQMSEISNDSRNLSYQEDEIYLQSDCNAIMDSKIDIEVTSTERSADINDNQSPSRKASKHLVSGLMQRKSTHRMSDDGSLAELATVAPEHPSPVSVLDASMYRDDTPSPVKQIPNALKDDGSRNSSDIPSEEKFNQVDNLPSTSTGSGLTSEINRKKLQNIEHLVQKLRRLNSNHDEASTDYIASLCENTNPDHRYISEILLASGLLLRDLSSSPTTFQLHPSGHPINPELFFVLEQTKASTSQSREEHSPGKVGHSKPDHEKCHRKLIFDAVNESLVKKLASVGPSPEPWLQPNKLARKTLSAQKLLRELCLEIGQLQANKSECSIDDEEDGIKSILWEDVMHRSESWTDFHGEISLVVLDVERSIFKDLVDEILGGEAASLRAKPGRRCRQLFAK
ncbi:hypothetical protein L1049_025296 [Liquidambar formosana]|uniref:DUF4378 domain-containing protein n=1 Tax=Liquidambar formosana TaxID=63359 RepID=A0AAP0QZZ7_LIQFO